MRLGHEIHYAVGEEAALALADLIGKVDRTNPANVKVGIAKIIKGLGFQELNTTANMLVEAGMKNIQNNDLEYGERLVLLGNIVRPINPSQGCECVGG